MPFLSKEENGTQDPEGARETGALLPPRGSPYKAVKLETVFVFRVSIRDLGTSSGASSTMTMLLKASGALMRTSCSSSSSWQHLLQRQHRGQQSIQHMRQQTRQQQQHLLTQ